MLKTIMLAMLGIMLFVGGGAGAWYFAQWHHAQELAQAEEAASDDAKAPLPNLEQVQKENPLAIALRPEGLSPDDIFRMSALMQEQTAALKKREADVVTKESRLQLVVEDMKLQQRELEGLLTQLTDTLTEARSVLSNVKDAEQRVKTERDNAQATLQQLDKSQREEDAGRQANVRKAATLLQQMDPLSSSAAIRRYCDDGKGDFAIELLSQIEERKAAEILNSLDDPNLVADLAERLSSDTSSGHRTTLFPAKSLRR